jgi:hypothetical protein
LGPWSKASVQLDASLDNPGAGGRLRQLTAGFETGGLSVGYQRDMFDGGVHGHTYRVGVGARDAHLAAGLAFALYRGDTKGSGWDAGVVYRAGLASFGTVLTNIRQPVVRGVLQRATLVPAVTLGGNHHLFALSVEGRITPDSSLGYAAGVRLATPGRVGLGVLARIDTDRSLRRTGWSFGLSIGARDVLGAVATIPRASSRIAALDVYGVSTRSAGR